MTGLIAFTLGTGEGGDIWTVRDDGSDAKQLTHGVTYGWVTWSRDGKRLLAATTFGRVGDDPGHTPDEVWILDANGNPLLKLSHASSDRAGFWQGSWSPDGTQVAIMSGSTAPGIQIVNADDSGASVISIPTIAHSINYGLPWSPNGARIAYATEPTFNSGQYSVETVSPSGGGSATMKAYDTSGYIPWSWFDATHLAIVRQTPTALLRTDGTTVVDLYDDPGDTSLSNAGSAVTTAPDGVQSAWTIGGFSVGIAKLDPTGARSTVYPTGTVGTDGISWTKLDTPTTLQIGDYAGGIVRLGD